MRIRRGPNELGRTGRAPTRAALVAFLGTLAAALLGGGPELEPPRAQAEETGGRGLTARYFDDRGMSRLALTRTDPRIDFNWGAGSPSRRVRPDTFAARWRGQVESSRAGTYTFYARASDGVRLWVDGKLIVDRWGRSDTAREWSGKVALEAGRRYRIRMDYYEGTGRASARLSYSGPGIAKQVVPARKLYLPATPAPTPPPPPPAECADGRDTDGDGRADHPADPGCSSAGDDSESPDPAPPPPSIEGAEPWSDPATWGGQVPEDGAAVTIPAGKTVALDRSVALGSLTVEGTLILAERDLELEADWIMVHGRLQAGTETDPFRHRATIRLRDQAPGENPMNMGDKVLGVMGGTLELHGERRLGWTKLGAAAARGSNRITLAEAPDWRPGDRIAIASTDFDQSQDEEATVTGVSGNVVTLDRQLEHAHFGTVQTYDGRQVDERAEVALLSRNLTVEGEAVSSADGFGGQVMVMGGGVARVEGAELERMGQRGILRRYPIHFHMLGDGGASSYLRDSSLHHTFNRCVTVHGTNRLAVTGNTCFDHLGHGFFLEDGAEHDNVLEGNLGMKTRRPPSDQRLLPSDSSPATFWITNPDNVVRDNVAAGSEGKGFWLALPEHPTGLFAATFPTENGAIWPRRTPLGEFSGNVAHSNGDDGLHVDAGPRPDGHTETTHHHARANPADTGSASVTTDFRGFTAYKNRHRAVWLRGTNHRLTGAVLADNAVGATFASDESFLTDSLLVGETANKGAPTQYELDRGRVGRDGRSLPRPWDANFPIRGYEFYDGRVGAERTSFVNFQPYVTPSGQTRQESALGYNLTNHFSIHPRNFATALRFTNANRVHLPDPAAGHDGDASSVFLDTDGSVTGTAGRTVAANNPFLLPAGCAARAEWNAHVCDGDYATLSVGTGDGDPAAIKPLKLTRSDGRVQTLMGSEPDSTRAHSSVLTGASYRAEYNGATPQRTRFVLSRGRDRWVRVSIPRAEGFRVTRYGCDLADPKRYCHGAATSLAALESATKSSYWYDNGGDADPATGTLHLKLVSTGTDYEELKVEPPPAP